MVISDVIAIQCQDTFVRHIYAGIAHNDEQVVVELFDLDARIGIERILERQRMDPEQGRKLEPPILLLERHIHPDAALIRMNDLDDVIMRQTRTQTVGRLKEGPERHGEGYALGGSPASARMTSTTPAPTRVGL